ncbi:branched-chain amino acid ABC transporter permease [Enterovirga rhinocerotis]|uniref:Amino acid/amide ABC transporter membrane protein 1 (HAAT family) n=1 Tax=Enterovirga rhinocerotis TaxID=1339210 RepID=A0A4R7BQV1_9HYPH|nr:branched-chain amino acid ABC transporter permease [Enterovirga rhinocerotis]TDR88054.1 amino acid/amide ABC transporter membrane protein 1 (HAAT family) [Enterovirga rhinocerotis]
MADLIQLLTNGLALGSVYALAAIGFVIVYSATGVVNFAAGQFVMLGTFAGVAMLLNAGLPMPVGYAAALIAMALFGALFYLVVYLPLRTSPVVTVIIGTVAIGITLQNAALLTFGSWPFRLPSPFEGMMIEVAGAVVSVHALAVVATTAVMIFLLWLLLHRTAIGIAMRAVAQDVKAARLMGLRVQWLLAFSWILGAVLAGVAGLMLGPMWFADVNMGDPIALKAFAATVIGGFGSLPGAIAGGLFVGLAEVLGASYISSAYKDLIAFGIMILFLLVRPQGIFGEPIQDRG